MTSDQASKRHEAACDAGAHTYADPHSGYQAFTRVGLLARGSCCGAGCRHCPYHHESVALEKRPRVMQQPAWLTDARPQSCNRVCCLFWSGGKDSYLAYRALQRSYDCEIVLMTTFDRSSGVIAHQELPIETIVYQAQYLGLPLVGVPLFGDMDYAVRVVQALTLIPQTSCLAFGDLHLTHIRKWREDTFDREGSMGHLELLFPLWQQPYEALLEDLTDSGVCCKVSAVTAQATGIQVGDVFDRAFVANLPAGVDPFGERGEFHTEVVFDEH